MAQTTDFKVVRDNLFQHIIDEWVDPYPAGPARTPIEFPKSARRFCTACRFTLGKINNDLYNFCRFYNWRGNHSS